MIVKAVDRITRILTAIGDSPEGLTNADLAKSLDLPKSTLSKILNSLAKFEWLSLEPVSKRYRLGPLNLSLAGKYIDKLDLARIGQKYLRRLKEETGEMACMEIPNGDEVVMVAKVAADGARVTGETFSGDMIRLAELGQRAPLYATAAGKCILAGRTDAEIDKFLQSTKFMPITPNTLTDLASLRGQIQEIRSSGLAYNLRELNPHTIAIAAPVLDLYGRSIAALAVITPDFRFDDQKQLQIEDSVRRAASEFSKLLGFNKNQNFS